MSHQTWPTEQAREELAEHELVRRRVVGRGGGVMSEPMSTVEWSDAEREAVDRAIAAWTLDDAEDRETQVDTVLDALAPFVAAREAQAAAKALREAAGAYRPGVVDRGYMARYLRDRADRIERGES